MEKDELLNCPFCGFPAELRKEYSEIKDCFYLCVRCSSCYAKSRTYKTAIDPDEIPGLTEKAIAKWNCRCPEGAVKLE